MATKAPPTLPDVMTMQEYLEIVFLIKHSEMRVKCGIMVGFIVVFHVLALLSLGYESHQKR